MAAMSIKRSSNPRGIYHERVIIVSKHIIGSPVINSHRVMQMLKNIILYETASRVVVQCYSIPHAGAVVVSIPEIAISNLDPVGVICPHVWTETVVAVNIFHPAIPG